MQVQALTDSELLISLSANRRTQRALYEASFRIKNELSVDVSEDKKDVQ
jgi:hypothetical protein